MHIFDRVYMETFTTEASKQSLLLESALLLLLLA
jgi:hypothetical protein